LTASTHRIALDGEMREGLALAAHEFAGHGLRPTVADDAAIAHLVKNIARNGRLPRPIHDGNCNALARVPHDIVGGHHVS